MFQSTKQPAAAVPPLTPAFPTPSRFTISPATPTDLPDVMNLFTLYAESLHIDLTFQSFAEELAGLPGKYAPPTGQILVAQRRRRAPLASSGLAGLNGDSEIEPYDEKSGACAISDTPAEALGCVAVRPITFAPPFDASFSHNTKKCEMKRLYTLPSTRGQGVGKALINGILKVATELGYDEMYLDTLGTMTTALAMYEKAGFVRTAAYYHNPNEGVVFLVKRLKGEE
ncbi:hypothetical protein TWF730_009118 [Orbilia blumenaviensis]|uniref:N-acetyltransferase domain-containing protein n=1 Tax=Orbilia blumenaviensis TaxID=1796055 RepID=A0AAV9V1D3_9PEZI